MEICTAASTVTAGLSGDAEVVTVAAATSTTARIVAGSAAAAADVAEGTGSVADTKLFQCLFKLVSVFFGKLVFLFLIFLCHVHGFLAKIELFLCPRRHR
jgi:hypothetical protein